jgi:hypothetical protein
MPPSEAWMGETSSSLSRSSQISGPPAATIQTVSESPPKPARSMRAAFALVLVIATAVAGLSLGFALRRGSATPTAAQPAVVIAPVRSIVRVALDSEPANAEVFEGARSLGHTPLRLEWTGPDGDPSRPHTFTFRLANHRDTQVTLTGASVAYSARLEAEQPAPIATGTPTNRTPPVRGTQAHSGSRTGPRPNMPPGYRWVDDW